MAANQAIACNSASIRLLLARHFKHNRYKQSSLRRTASAGRKLCQNAACMHASTKMAYEIRHVLVSRTPAEHGGRNLQAGNAANMLGFTWNSLPRSRADTTMRQLRSSLSIFFAVNLTWLALTVTTSQAADAHSPRRLLFFNRSVAFQHSVVQVKDGKPCYAETILQPICKEHDWELVSTKDGGIFTPENIAKFDAFLFYTQGDLAAEKSKDGSPPMSKEGKQAFLDAIKEWQGIRRLPLRVGHVPQSRRSLGSPNPSASAIRTSTWSAASSSFISRNKKRP